MSGGIDIQAIVDALGLPASARVDQRVPKKLLVEQGAPTSADKRAIQDGIDELQWFAACKPSNIAVPVFKDGLREYAEIAVIGCAFREGAKAARLIELIHRAIPYPVLLITAEAGKPTVSAAHKRQAQNDSGKWVLERLAFTDLLSGKRAHAEAFLAALSLAKQPRHDLFSLYEGWVCRIEALNAASLSGLFSVSDARDATEQRREALDAHTRISREVAVLRAKAGREKQMNRRVDLNLEIQRLEADLQAAKQRL